MRVDIQAGSGSGPENGINLNVIEEINSPSLGISGTNLSSSLQALDELDNALSQVQSIRGKVVAVGGRLVIFSNDLATRVENLIRSESTLADTDLVAEIFNLERGLLRFQTSIQTLANQNLSSGQITGRLLDTIG